MRRSVFLLALAWFALSSTARAVDPPPDGGYPGANTAEGEDALLSLTSGVDNTAVGFNALLNNTSGDLNTATGFDALFNNTTGGGNTADGSLALFSNTTGIYNTATGVNALRQNTTGDHNTANGVNALSSNTTGFNNTATGSFALNSNTTGLANTANGVQALEHNTTGHLNTATGAGALSSNTTGSLNTANGLQALFSNTKGSENTADGYYALLLNTTGSENTASGLFALLRNTTGRNNIALGFQAGANLTTGNSNIHIGNTGLVGESNHIRIGTKGTHAATFVAGIYGATVGRGVGVVVGPNGHLGTVVSSARFKKQIKPMDKSSEAILALQPVTFRYEQELDPEGIPQFGLVAEEVEKVNPALVARDDEGKAYTVRYEAVNAMLLNEFLKEHRKLQEQDATITQMKTQIEALTAGLQKVSDQLEVSKAAPQMVANN